MKTTYYHDGFSLWRLKNNKMEIFEGSIHVGDWKSSICRPTEFDAGDVISEQDAAKKYPKAFVMNDYNVEVAVSITISALSFPKAEEKARQILEKQGFKTTSACAILVKNK